MAATTGKKICTNCIEKETSPTEQLSPDFSALNFWSNYDEEIAVAERMAENIGNPNGTVIRGQAIMKFY